MQTVSHVIVLEFVLAELHVLKVLEVLAGGYLD